MTQHDMDSSEQRNAAFEAIWEHAAHLKKTHRHEHVDGDTIAHELRLVCDESTADWLLANTTQRWDEQYPNVLGFFDGDTCMAIYWRAEADVEVSAAFDAAMSERARDEDDEDEQPEAGYCKHGVYVGGCGIDWMCGDCEAGTTDAEIEQRERANAVRRFVNLVSPYNCVAGILDGLDERAAVMPVYVGNLLSDESSSGVVCTAERMLSRSPWLLSDAAVLDVLG